MFGLAEIVFMILIHRPQIKCKLPIDVACRNVRELSGEKRLDKKVNLIQFVFNAN